MHPYELAQSLHTSLALASGLARIDQHRHGFAP
jgi:hypothetical protein